MPDRRAATIVLTVDGTRPPFRAVTVR